MVSVIPYLAETSEQSRSSYQQTDRSLVRQCLQGDRHSYQQLYRRYQAQVRSSLYQLCGPSHLDDLVQEVFLRVWKGLPKFRQASQFSTWLYRIVWNVASTKRRQLAQAQQQTLSQTVEQFHLEFFLVLFMASDYIYLHGFASSPNSRKALYIRDRLSAEQITLQIPDLNQGDFSYVTLTRQLRQVEALCPDNGKPVSIIGFCFGGLTAAWLGQLHSQVQRLVLLAPAFQFLDHWLPQLGVAQVERWQQEQYLPVYHYGEKRSLPLHYQFVIDLDQYQEEQLQRKIPTLILHGRDDKAIPIQASRDFASQRPWVQMRELDSDHGLANVLPEIWQEILKFRD